MEKQFETTGPINLTVELYVGDVTLRTHESTTTTIRLHPHGSRGEEHADKFVVEARGNDVVVLAPKKGSGLLALAKGTVDVEVDLPAGSTVDARTGSGDISGSGVYAEVRVATGSGDVTVDEVGTGEAKSGSGDVRLRIVRAGASLKTGSGDLVVDLAGGRIDAVSGSGDVSIRRIEAGAKVKTGSGDVVVGSTAGDLDLLTGTGDVRVDAVHGGELRAKTGTGDVVLGVPHGVAAYLDLNTVTGDVAIDLDDAVGPDDAESTTALTVHSGSGDIHVKRAQVSLS